MAALASAFVRIRPVTTGFRKEVEDGLRGAGTSAGEKFGDEFVRGADGRLRDSRGKFVATGNTLGASTGKGFVGGLKSSGDLFAKVALTMAARATVLTAALAAATPAAANFVAAIAPAAGAAVGIAPALLAATAAISTFKVATSGVGNAVDKGLTGSTKAYEDALAKLVPAQKAVVQQVVAMKSRFEGLRQTVAQQFFAPLRADITPLANTLFPLLSTQMGALGGKLGLLGHQIALAARSQPVIKLITDTFTATGGAVDVLRARVSPLIQAFARLGASTLPILKTITTDLDNVIVRVTAWANRVAASGSAVATFERARIAIGQIRDVLENLGAIAGNVFRAMGIDGAGFLGTLTRLTAEARAFTESAKGGQALKDLFATLGVLGETMRRTLAGVLPEVGRSLEIAAPAATALAQAVSRLLIALGPLLPALTQSAAVIAQAFVPVLNTLAGLLEDNQGLLTAIAPFIVAYAVATKAAGVATGVATLAHRAHAAAVAFSKGTIGTWIGVKALELGAWVKSTAAIVGNRIAMVAHAVASGTAAAATRLWVGAMMVGSWVKATAAILAQRVATVAHTVATGLAAVATKAWTIATNIAAVAMRAAGVALRFMMGPIGIAITVIGLLTGAIVWLYKNNETARKIIDAVWAWIKKAIKAVGDWFVNTLWPSMRRAIDQLVAAFNWTRDMIRIVWTAIQAVITTHWNAIRTVFNAVKDFITVTIPNAFNAGRALILGHWNAIRTSISNGWDRVRGYFTSLKDFIMVTLPQAFGRGVDAIRSAWEKVQEAARKPVAFVVNSVINPLIRGYNNVAGVFNAPKGDEIRGFHSGGRIPGAPSATDNRIATVVDKGRRALGNIKVATGEYVVNAKSTAANLPLIQAINSARGSLFATQPARVGGVNTGLDGLADGGPIGDFFDKVKNGVKGVGNFIANPAEGLRKLFDSAMGRIPGGGKIADMLKGMANKVFSGVKSFLSGGMFTGGGGGGGDGSSFGKWPSSPGAQRGDSGVWRRIVAMIRASGINQGAFGNGYRPGDPKWHGSGRAVDWMGFNMDALASFLAQRNPLELIHRTRNRDYAYTRGRNQGSFNESLMNAHRNHIHIAMRRGGLIGKGVTDALANSSAVKLLDRGGSWPSGMLGFNASGHTETVLTGGPNGDMSELKDLLREQNTLLRALGGEIASALERPTRRAVQLGRSGAPVTTGRS